MICDPQRHLAPTSTIAFWATQVGGVYFPWPIQDARRIGMGWDLPVCSLKSIYKHLRSDTCTVRWRDVLLGSALVRGQALLNSSTEPVTSVLRSCLWCGMQKRCRYHSMFGSRLVDEKGKRALPQCVLLAVYIEGLHSHP